MYVELSTVQDVADAACRYSGKILVVHLCMPGVFADASRQQNVFVHSFRKLFFCEWLHPAGGEVRVRQPQPCQSMGEFLAVSRALCAFKA
jgi:hypothetical protein